MSQKDQFLASEGDQYHRRNRHKLTLTGAKAANDRVVGSVEALRLEPRSILEIGCANGWRLARLKAIYDATCVGIDPSAEAIAEGSTTFPGLALQQGTAESLAFAAQAFDLVIFGFCLYLCDRDHLFRIAAEADRVLQEEGHLVIEDFHPPFPYANPYAHRPGMWTYKMNYAALFSWNPSYTLVSQLIFDHQGRSDVTDPDSRVSVSVLVKNTQHAYPHHPFTTL
jgi:ubiquinone/menaquinone biosynthesis C-methylase UbiE